MKLSLSLLFFVFSFNPASSQSESPSATDPSSTAITSTATTTPSQLLTTLDSNDTTSELTTLAVSHTPTAELVSPSPSPPPVTEEIPTPSPSPILSSTTPIQSASAETLPISEDIEAFLSSVAVPPSSTPPSEETPSSSIAPSPPSPSVSPSSLPPTEFLSFNEWREKYAVPVPPVADASQRRARKAAQRARQHAAVQPASGGAAAGDAADLGSLFDDTGSSTTTQIVYEGREGSGEGSVVVQLDELGGIRHAVVIPSAGDEKSRIKSIGEEGVSKDLDDARGSSGGGIIQPLPNVGTGDHTDPLLQLKDRSNYALFECAAMVHRSSPETKGAGAILVEKKDRYMLTPCSVEQKFVELELCEEIRIDTIVLANFELFSSMFKGFKIRVSQNYPGRPDEWHDLGTFRARNMRGVQVFRPSSSLLGFYRYMRIDFVSHYGSEYYCPVSLLRVYGLTQIDAWRRDEEATKAREAALAASNFEDEEEYELDELLDEMDGKLDVGARGWEDDGKKEVNVSSTLEDVNATTILATKISTVESEDQFPSTPSTDPTPPAESNRQPTTSVAPIITPPTSSTSKDDVLTTSDRVEPDIPTSLPTSSAAPSGVESTSSVPPAQDSSDIIELSSQADSANSSPNPSLQTPTTVNGDGAPSADSPSPTPNPKIVAVDDPSTPFRRSSSSTSSVLSTPETLTFNLTESTSSPPSSSHSPTITTPIEDISSVTLSAPSTASTDVVSTPPTAISIPSSSSSETSSSTEPEVTFTPASSGSSPTSSHSQKVTSVVTRPSPAYSDPPPSNAAPTPTNNRYSQRDEARQHQPPVIPAPQQPQPGESIYGIIMKRLGILEVNQTISMSYIEAQGKMLQDAFARMDMRLSEVENAKQKHDQLLRQGLLELEKHYTRVDREKFELAAQVSVLTQELLLEKRLSIAQLIGLLVLLIFVGVTRGSPTSPLLHLVQAPGLRRLSAPPGAARERTATAKSKAVVDREEDLRKANDPAADGQPKYSHQRATSVSRLPPSKRFSLPKPVPRRHYGVVAPSSTKIRAWTPPPRTGIVSPTPEGASAVVPGLARAAEIITRRRVQSSPRPLSPLHFSHFADDSRGFGSGPPSSVPSSSGADLRFAPPDTPASRSGAEEADTEPSAEEREREDDETAPEETGYRTFSDGEDEGGDELSISSSRKDKPSSSRVAQPRAKVGKRPRTSPAGGGGSRGWKLPVNVVTGNIREWDLGRQETSSEPPPEPQDDSSARKKWTPDSPIIGNSGGSEGSFGSI